MRSQDFLNEDWQKANKSDKTDGMSQKAVNAYRRENPGSKLKTAVTTPPSKLKKGSKDSKRRKSFCARSNGQKKMHNIDCSKTPDKAICAARRRWNCEEDVQQLEQALAEATFGTEPKRPAREGSRPARGHDAKPRYKSAPVVPGGDNPDAPHKPNKGDEPVERGDRVLVQDPDNIATVYSGVVKRIGREFVYVTLKNGETIAASHDEVSKSYDVLSKRAHLILNKKGKHVGNYKVDESSEKLTWSDLGNSLSVEEKLSIFEEYLTKGNLTESNDEHTIKYFSSLSKFSDKLNSKHQYIVVPMILINNQVSLLDKPEWMKYVGSRGSVHVFNGESGNKEYPIKQIRGISASETFTFATQASYDKFKTALALKFNVDLPSVENQPVDEVAIDEIEQIELKDPTKTWDRFDRSDATKKFKPEKIEKEKEDEYGHGYLGKTASGYLVYADYDDWLSGDGGDYLRVYGINQQGVPQVVLQGHTNGRGKFAEKWVYASPGNTMKAHELYQFLILNKGWAITSDVEHTQGAIGIWRQLMNTPGITVQQYGGKKHKDLPNQDAAYQKKSTKMIAFRSQGVVESYKPRSKIEERLTSQEKFEKHLKKHGYDVNEKAKYWDAKIKELERQRDEYEKELASRKQSNVGEMAAPGAVASKVTRVQGKEYLVHSLPADMSKVKLVTDDSGKQVYIWVEKVGMRPQYTYYWFAPAQAVQEGWGDVARLAALPVIAGAAAAGGQWLDNRTPKVDIGGKQVMVVNNPGWGTIPSNAMTLTGKDGKEYKVWKGSGKGTSQWLATPVENVKESMCAKHISPSGAETTMCPDDDDYEINYGKDSGIADFRKKQGLDVKTGKKVKEECAGVGIVTKQNSTADVGPGTIGKNLKAFKLESHDDDEYVQQLTSEFIRRAKLGRRYTPAETILGMLDRFFKKFAINGRYFDDVFHRVVRTTDHEAGILEMETDLEEWKASRQLCRSSTPDSELGASALASCKSQGLRARDGNKSHKLGKSPKSRIKVGGHRIKGKAYGGPLPDYGSGS